MTRIYAVALVAPFLFRLPLPAVARLLEPWPRRRGSPPRTVIDQLVARVDRCLARGRPVVRSGCLTRGATLYHVLRRAGAPVALRFGIGEIDGAAAGHCWIEYAGGPLAEIRDPRPIFAVTWSIEPT